MAILGDGRGGVFCENSLEHSEAWKEKMRDKVKLENFDVVITNPPYGSKIKVVGEQILSQFQLAYKWSFNKKENVWEKSNKLKESDAPQYIFIERCMQFLKPGGRMALVLPDGIFGNDKLGYIRQYISTYARLFAIIDIPKETFLPHTPTKTTVLVVQKYRKTEQSLQDYPVFMAVCETCGHDRRGNLTEDDDILNVASNFKKWREENGIQF